MSTFPPGNPGGCLLFIFPVPRSTSLHKGKTVARKDGVISGTGNMNEVHTGMGAIYHPESLPRACNASLSRESDVKAELPSPPALPFTPRGKLHRDGVTR